MQSPLQGVGLKGRRSTLSKIWATLVVPLPSSRCEVLDLGYDARLGFTFLALGFRVFWVSTLGMQVPACGVFLDDTVARYVSLNLQVRVGIS